MGILMNDLFSIFMALTAYSFLSTGFVLMKMGIGWIGWQGKRNRIFYRNLFWWIFGFIIMNIYGIPSAVALKRLPPHTVAAVAGWGIVVLVFLSRFLLKEKLFKSDFFFSLLIVAGIFLLNFFERPASYNSINITGMVFLCMLPVILFFPGFINRLSGKIKTLVFASACGISAGLMVVCLGLLVLKYQYKIALYFGSPYLYLYIGFALLSFIALQLACKTGPMMIIGPVQYSTNIIYPLLAAIFVFGRLIHLIQFLSIGLIIFSVIHILKKR
jgi:multidrug transporter EmrE-like cation transporter